MSSLRRERVFRRAACALRRVAVAGFALSPAMWCRIVIAGLILAIYLPSLSAPFIWDDQETILRNPAIADLSSFSFLGDPGEGAHPLNNRPLVSLTFALDYARTGLDPAGFRLSNIFIHLLCALTLFEVVRSGLRTGSLASRFASRAVPLAGVIAALWSVHPLNAEPVLYLTQRTESLMALFYLLAIWGILRYGEAESTRSTAGTTSSRADTTPTASGRSPQASGWTAGPAAETRPPTLPSSEATTWWSFATVAAVVLGVFSKEIILSAPIFLLLLDRALLSGSFRRAFERHGRLHLATFSTWGLLAALMMEGAEEHTIGFGLGMTSWEYLRVQTHVLNHYFFQTVWPSGLALSYDFPVPERLSDYAGQATLVLAGLTATIVGLARNRPVALLGALVFLVLGPTSSFIPLVNEPAVERRMYLPSAAIVTLLVLLLEWVRCFLSASGPSLRTSMRTSTFSLKAFLSAPASFSLAAALIIGALSAATLARGQIWSSEESIWRNAIAYNEADVRALNNLAQVYLSRGEYATARPHLVRALEVKPSYAEAWHNLGIARMHLGELDSAADALDRAIALRPASAISLVVLAGLRWRQGDDIGALRAAERAIEVDPGSGEAHLVLGRLQLQNGDTVQASVHLSAAARLLPEESMRQLARTEIARLGQSEKLRQPRQLRRPEQPNQSEIRRVRDADDDLSRIVSP